MHILAQYISTSHIVRFTLEWLFPRRASRQAALCPSGQRAASSLWTAWLPPGRFAIAQGGRPRRRVRRSHALGVRRLVQRARLRLPRPGSKQPHANAHCSSVSRQRPDYIQCSECRKTVTHKHQYNTLQANTFLAVRSMKEYNQPSKNTHVTVTFTCTYNSILNFLI
jgi:hypothetical protein